MRKIILALFCILGIAGCATVPQVSAPQIAGMPGIYHCVEKGQTLWRISKIYNIDLDEIVRINRISDAASIETGQLIFIPNRKKAQRLSATQYSSDDFIWPLKGTVISAFGQTSNNMLNKGLDIRPYGDLTVVATRNGKVIFLNDNFATYGKTIIIDHGDGLTTVYARNQEVSVRAGEKVEKGAVIAKAGSSGRDKSVYLHFEIRKGHTPQNPYHYLP